MPMSRQAEQPGRYGRSDGLSPHRLPGMGPARQCILGVEDDPDIAALLRLIFDPACYVVTVAEDLAVARATLAEAPPPDLIILDVELPDGNGLDLCRELKATWPALPVLVLTAQDEVRAEAFEAGATLFMPKPFDPNDLAATVEELLHPT